MNSKRLQGFTLMEMMIVVALIGIIAAIAIPSYQSSVEKTRRVDAQSSLMSFAAALERHYAMRSNYIGADNGSDSNGSIPDAAVFAAETPLEGPVKFYDLRFTFTTVSYTVFAYPKGAQAGNGALSLSSTNARAWDSANDGTFSEPW